LRSSISITCMSVLVKLKRLLYQMLGYKKFQLSLNFFTLIVNFLRVCSRIVIVMVMVFCVKWCIVGVRNLFLVEMNINIWYGCWSCRLYTTNSWLTVSNFCFSTTILLLHF
jgi:hypothetical protein